MALGETNTFALPSSAKSIALSRIDYNDSHKSVLQNFYSDAIPVAINITIEGDQVTPLDGTIYRSSLTGRVYIKDTKYNKGNPVYGANWTRNGIGPFVEDSLALADFNTYEIGELFAVIGSNAGLYMKSTNAGAIIDVGAPRSNSITTSLIIDSAITSDKLANATIANIDIAAGAIESDKIASNTIANTNLLFDGVTTDRIANASITGTKIALG